jgi:RNA polymerase-binding transcription factor DksA
MNHDNTAATAIIGPATLADILGPFHHKELYEPKPEHQKYHRQLLKLRDKLLETTRSNTSELRENAGIAKADDNNESASEIAAIDDTASLLRSQTFSLLEINQALNRIKNGSYGICEITKQKIPEERLDALPTAKTMASTQKQIEDSLKYKQENPAHDLLPNLNLLSEEDETGIPEDNTEQPDESSPDLTEESDSDPTEEADSDLTSEPDSGLTEEFDSVSG